MVFVVILLSKRFVVVPDHWVETQTIREETKVFFSPDPNEQPNFQLTAKFLFNKDESHVYKGYVLKHFGKYKNQSHISETISHSNMKPLLRFRG